MTQVTAETAGKCLNDLQKRVTANHGDEREDYGVPARSCAMHNESDAMFLLGALS